jgi:4-hydroxyphenylpyruvate dioxygenase-like putative hemolysin
MTAMNGVPLTQVLQVAVVVENLQRSMEQYWQTMGIGPWQVYTFQPPALTNPRVRGVETPYTMKLALAQVGAVQWELIEPLEGPSIYKEFLAQHGEGLHHCAFATGDMSFQEAVAAFAKLDIPILMQGTWNGITYAYMDTEKRIGTIVEIYDWPEGITLPPPEEVYPA